MQSQNGYERRVTLLSLSLIVAGIILATLTSEGWLLLDIASLTAGLAIVIGDGLARTIALVAWSVVASTTGEYMLPVTVAAGYVAGATYRPNQVEPLSSREARRLTLIPAFYTPILLVYPVSIVPLASYTIAVMVEWIRASARLSRVKALVVERDVSVVYGEEARVPVLIDTQGVPVYYSLIVDGVQVDRGYGAGKLPLGFNVKPRIIGVERHRVEAVIVDDKGLARRRMGPYTVRVKASLASAKAILRIRRVLSAYREIIGRPLIYKGIPPRIAVEVEGPEAGAGAEGEGAGEGERGEGRGELGVGGGVPLSSIILPVEAEPGEEYTWIPFSTGREYGGGPWHRGDYRGVREYLPGDKPTQIHWKKSISRRELVVKTYEAGGEGGGGGGKLLVVADWVSRSPEELDELVKKTYSAVLQGMSEKHLVLRAPSGVVYYLRGGVPELLAGLDELIRAEGVLQRLNYDGWSRMNVFEEFHMMLRSGGRLSRIARYYIAHARALVSSLKRLGVEEGIAYTMIYSDATALRNHALQEVLNNTFTASQPVPDIPLEEVAENLKRYLVAYRA